MVDTIIKNCKSISFDSKGNKLSHEGIAIKGEKIAAVGTNDDVMKFCGDDTKIIDAAGKTVLPGLCDSHLHVSSTAELLFSIPIYYIEPEHEESRDAYLDRLLAKVKDFADSNSEAPVIRATGWNPSAFKAMGGMPVAAELDRVSKDRPVLLRSYCHHFLWLNSKALEMTGITKESKLGQGFVVEKDAEGNPTGIFIDIPATELVLDSFELADFSVEEYKAGILNYQKEYAWKNGITSVFDAFLRPHAIEAYRQLAQEGRLTMRVRGAFLANPERGLDQFDEMIANKEKFNVGDDFRMDTVKFFFDGGELTQLMSKPFNPEILKAQGYPEDYCGPYIWYPDQAKMAFEKVCRAGFQIHIHVMGDKASKEALDTFQYIDSLGIKGLRHTLTHIMFIDESDIQRMADMGIVASMQAHWAIVDSFSCNYVQPLFGRERCDRVYPLGEMIRKGVKYSVATDFPIDFNYNSMQNIQIAATRSVPKSHREYEQYKGRVAGPDDDPDKYYASVDEVIKGYTMGGAYQLFMENLTGSMEVGKSADMIILDADLENTDIIDYEDVKVEKVIFKGKEI